MRGAGVEEKDALGRRHNICKDLEGEREAHLRTRKHFNMFEVNIFRESGEHKTLGRSYRSWALS